MKSDREELLKSILSNDLLGFEDFVAKYGEALTDALDLLSGKEIAKFWHVSSLYVSAVEHPDVNRDITTISQVLCSISSAVSWWISSERPNLQFASETIAKLSSVLVNAEVQWPTSLKQSIAKVCETWWFSSGPGAENLIPNLIPFLLVNSLRPQSFDIDVKRVYSVRASFMLLDFEDSSIESIRDLIQRCFLHPTFLKCADGNKFLAFIFQMNNGAFIPYALEVIRPQLLHASKAICHVYGEILFKAWKEAHDTGAQSAIDVMEEAVQKLVQEAFHTANPKYFKALRMMVRAFHDVTRSKEVDAMLLRIYNPILWRTLKCANAIIRAQAASIYLDVFPLQNADMTAEEEDKMLQKQFDALSAILRDGDHRVRAIGVAGCCHILREYWEVLPSGTTINLLKYMVETLAFDVSNANVRYAVFTGLYELLEQPLAHNVLKNLLPLVRNSVHDTSEKVRGAFIKILCQVKSMKGVHFYDIVPVEQLLQRMALDYDHPAITNALTELLLPSFFPLGDGTQSLGSVQIQRMFQFIRENPNAAEVFYSNLHKHIPAGKFVKFSVMAATVLFDIATLYSSQPKSAIMKDLECEPVVVAKPKATAGGGKRRRGEKDKDSKKFKIAADAEEEPSDLADLTDLSKMDSRTKTSLARIILIVLRNVERGFASGDLGAESRALFFRYFTAESMQCLLQASMEWSANPELSQILPVVMQILGLYEKILHSGEEQGAEARVKGKSKAWDMNSLLEWHCSSDNTAQQSEEQAASLVRMLQMSGHEASLLKFITGHFGAGSKKSKAKNNKSKSQQASSVSSVAVVGLLDWVVKLSGEADVEDGFREDLHAFMVSLGDLLAADMESIDQALSSACIAKLFSVWTAYALQQDAFQMLTDMESAEKLEIHFNAENLRAILAWLQQRVLASDEDDRVVAELVGTALYSVADAFIVGILDPELIPAAQELMAVVQDRMDCDAYFALIPAVAKLSVTAPVFLSMNSERAGAKDLLSSMLSLLCHAINVSEAKDTVRVQSEQALKALLSAGKKANSDVLQVFVGHILAEIVDMRSKSKGKGSKGITAETISTATSLMLTQFQSKKYTEQMLFAAVDAQQQESAAADDKVLGLFKELLGFSLQEDLENASMNVV